MTPLGDAPVPLGLPSTTPTCPAHRPPVRPTTSRQPGLAARSAIELPVRSSTGTARKTFPRPLSEASPQTARMLRISVDRAALLGGPNSHFGGNCWLLLNGYGNARWGEGLSRFACGCATMWRPTGRVPMTTTWPRARASRSGTSRRQPWGPKHRFCAGRRSAGRRGLRGSGSPGYDVETGRAEGPAADRRSGGAVRRGGGQRPEDVVAGRRAAPGDRRRLRRGAGPGGAARSSAGSPSTPPPGSARGAGRCRCRSSRSRR